MKAIERRAYSAHYISLSAKNKIRHSEEIIRKALAMPGRNWAISFSGGKDSTVLLDLARKIEPALPVVWLDDGWDYPETIRFLRETEKHIGKIIRVTDPDASSFEGETGLMYPGDDPAYEHVSDMLFGEFQEVFDTIIGIRKDESGRRRWMIEHHGFIFHSAWWKQWKCCPLAYWSDTDVWAYIVGNKLVYNPVYDKLSEIGVPVKYQRVGPLTAWMVWQYGALEYIKIGWPELYRRFVTTLGVEP